MEMSPSGRVKSNKREMPKKEGCRYIVNAGSVGQPRDGDPRACYAIADEDRIELVRVAYDIQAIQKKMSDAGLPQILIDRLSHGL